MRLKEFATILEYLRDVTAAKLGAQLIAAARKDHSLDASTDWFNTAHTTDVILSKLEAMDPTRNQQYVQWLAKQYIRGQFRLEDRPAVHQTLVDYTKLKPRLNPDQRDINRLDYHTTVELVDRILNPKVGLDVDSQGTFPVIKDTKVLYNGPLGQLSQPQTEAASCELGSGTKWCTAATKTANKYQYYDKVGTLTVWRDRSGDKYQFFIPDRFIKGYGFEFADSGNRPINAKKLNEFRTQHPVLQQWFRQTEQVIIKDAVLAVRYAMAIHQRWPEAEPVISQNAQVAAYYALRVIRDRWPEAEDIIAQDARAATFYASEVIRDRWPEAEDIIAQEAQPASDYAQNVLRKRWPRAEDIIAQDAQPAMKYALNVIGGRWPEAEPVIRQDERSYRHYLNVVTDLGA